MKVKLSVVNRLSILGLLPNKGDITTIKIIREMNEEISFNADEHAALNFRQLAGNKLAWNEDIVSDREFEFEGIREVIIEKVKTQLREMEHKGDLSLDYLSLYEVLIEGVPSPTEKSETIEKEKREKLKVIKEKELGKE